MIFDDFYEEVITTLGGTLVDVELVESDIKICLKKAIRTFKQKGHNNFRRQFLALPVEVDTQIYPLPDSPRIDTVVKIMRPDRETGFNSTDPLSIALYDQLFGNVLGGGHCGTCRQADFLTYELALQLQDMRSRYAAFETQFHHDKFNNTIEFYNNPRADATWIVECYTDLTEEEYMDVDWIIRWTVAEAKEMLGLAYRKFGSLPGPNGETSLDGNSLIQDAKTEKEALIEDILNFVDGDIDFMEIRFG